MKKILFRIYLYTLRSVVWALCQVFCATVVDATLTEGFLVLCVRFSSCLFVLSVSIIYHATHVPLGETAAFSCLMTAEMNMHGQLKNYTDN